MRSEVTRLLLRRLDATPVVADPRGGVRLARPIDLDAFALAYAEAMGWPGGEARWKVVRSEEATARLLLWLDGLSEEEEQNNAA